jgi:dihydropteroate synthase
MLWHLRDRTIQFERRPLVMGIVNVTPDSFSDGGQFEQTEAAVAHGLKLVREGADLLDIGGESTRPGAVPVPLDEELRRVVPVVQALAPQVAVPLSVDTSKAEVARQSLAAGACVVNDVTALAGDAVMTEVVATFQAGVILMHMQGTPATMQQNPHYDDVVSDIGRYFEERLQAIATMGIPAERTVLDPGIGFGKTAAHNLEILARLEDFQWLGRPVCLGVSRKGFLGRRLGDRPIQRRLAASLGIACYALSRQAVQVVRVHDVEETRDALTLFALLDEHRTGRSPDSKVF